MAHLAVLACLLFAAQAAPSPQLDVDFRENGTYQLTVNGQVWLESAPLRAFIGGNWKSASDGLTVVGSERHRGSDELGLFTCVNVSWRVEGSATELHTSLSLYEDGLTAIFTQELPAGAEGTNASNPVLPKLEGLNGGNSPPNVAFPAFRAQGGLLKKLGFVTWRGLWGKLAAGVGVVGQLQGLSSNGPVVLFDGNYTAVVVSPMDNFKNAVHHGGQAWETGVSSEVLSLPAGFRHRTLVKLGASVTGAVDAWGTALRKAYGTRRAFDNDLSTSYLSYWTDNGAYYNGDSWHRGSSPPNRVNETTMLGLATAFQEQGLLGTVKILQLDDWWYPGYRSVSVNCVANWTLKQPAFNRSLGNLSSAIKTPWLLYVPFFCSDSVYAKDFKFVQSVPGLTNFSEPHPDDALAFYRMLFDYGLANGMKGYEHDFLNYNFLAVPDFRQNLGHSERWLGAIDAAATERNMSVQMCMALPSDMMASVRYPSYTNYRASDDYVNTRNWDVGANSLLAFGLGLRPSKDTFWSHRAESVRETTLPWPPSWNPGSHCELHAIIATLSTGPVGLSDKAGDTNKTIVFRSVRPDGLIVQPSRPATSIDATFWQPSLGNQRQGPQNRGLVWGTHAAISRGEAGEPASWHYFLTVNVTTSWQLADVDFYPPAKAASGWVARRWHSGHAPTPCHAGEAAVKSGCVASGPIKDNAAMPTFLNDRPVMMQNDTITFDLWQLSPIEGNGWVLLGDISRYTSVSSKRFPRVASTASGLNVTVVGAPGEDVEVTALAPSSAEEWEVVQKQVSFSSQRTQATLEFAAGVASIYA